MTGRYGFAALIALYILIRVWNPGAFCLDSDEVFSVTTARHGWGALLPAIANDLVHPPLWYVLLKLWRAIGGESLVWMRLLPAALSIAALVPLFALFRTLELSFTARVLTLGLAAVNGYQVYHARYLRMYALLFLLGLLSLEAFLNWLDKGGNRRFASLTAINVLLVYAHYFGWMLVLAEGAALAWTARAKLKRYILGSAIVAAAFAPWLIAVARSARAAQGLEPNLRWIRHPGWGDLAWFYAGLNGALVPIPLASAMALLTLAILAIGRARGLRHARVLALAAALPPLASFALSITRAESVWGSRHLIIAAVPYMILLAASAAALKPPRLRRAAIAILAAWTAWSAYHAAFRPEPQVNLEAIARQLAARCANQRSVTVYSLDPYLPKWMGYYLESSKWRLLAIPNVDAVSGERFWFAYNEKFWKSAVPPKDLLRGKGYDPGPGIWAADEWNRIVVIPVERRR